MHKADIQALMRAHRGRARVVASLYLLRQPSLDADDLDFLEAHAEELGVLDLQRWWTRSDRGRTAAIVRQVARLARRAPDSFYEVLATPSLEMTEDERRELLELLRGEVAPEIWARITAPRPPRAAEDSGAAAPWAEGESLLEALDLCGDDEVGAPFGWAEAPLEGAALQTFQLEQLEQQGAPRAALMEMTMAALRSAETPDAMLSWFARSWLPQKLASRAAWDDYGADVIGALIGRGAFAELTELLAGVWGADRGSGFEGAVQYAFALALVREAREAAERADEARAVALLSALICLDPPSRVSPALHTLRRSQGLGAEAMELVLLNERLVKHGRGRDGSLEDVIAAVHALADTLA